MLHEQRRGVRHSFERADGQQPIERRRDIRSGGHTARRVNTPEHGMQRSPQLHAVPTRATNDSQDEAH